jgi:hypothetical protein
VTFSAPTRETERKVIIFINGRQFNAPRPGHSRSLGVTHVQHTDRLTCDDA